MAFTGGVGGSLQSGVIDQDEFLDMEESLAECISHLRACEEHGEHCTQPNCWTPLLMPIGAKNLNPYDLRKQCTSPPLCYDQRDEERFLQLPEVQLKLGVPQPRAWTDCNDTVHGFFENSGDFYSRTNDTVAYLLSSDVPVLVYHGDTDFMCDWIGGKRWVSDLAWKHHHAWNRASDVPFMVNGRAAGQERSFGGFTFMQLYESGHMVPMDQPENSLAMLREFLSPESRWKQARADHQELNAIPSSSSGSLGLALCASVAALAAVAASHKRSSKEYSGQALLEA
jgi:cathepsin A (carboxypeptidase C)